MIDRLELKTSRYGHFIESRNKHLPRGISQLVNEDQDVVELKRTDLNPLYRNSIVHSVLVNNGVPTDDPVKFYIFADPRFNKQQTERYKIVFNPNKTPFLEVLQFIHTNFSTTTGNDDFLYDDLKIGRIDFNVDITTHSVHDIFRILFLDRKTQKHLALYDEEDADGLENGMVRTIGTKEMETFYIGKGSFILRVYDKVKEAKHRISVLKGNDMPIPATLAELAAMPRLTRLEIQIRDLYRAGVQKVDTKTGETNVFRPTKSIYNVRTFLDLIKIRREQFDVFSDLKFKTREQIKLARPTLRATQKQKLLNQEWIVEALNRLIDDIGYDTVLKKLDKDTRNRVKKQRHDSTFQHDLNSICFEEVAQWLKPTASTSTASPAP